MTFFIHLSIMKKTPKLKQNCTSAIPHSLAAFEKNRGNFYKGISGSELMLEGPVLSSAILPAPLALFVALIQSSDTSDTAPCKTPSTEAVG